MNTLLAQLDELNDRTWKADASQVHASRIAGAAPGSTLKTSAKFAFSLFLELAQAAAKHQLPMKLDY